jgi:predicted ArsR family transcriptional regulator
LEREARPLHASEVARTIGPQRNTARRHLELLCSIGLIKRVDEHRGDPGRPRLMYEFVRAWLSSSQQPTYEGAVDYEALTQLLIAGLEATGDAADVARRAGMRWAQVVANDPSHTGALSAGEEVDVLADVLTQLGFDPEPDLTDDRIVLHRYPFEDVVRKHRSVVCAMHLGMLQATANRLSSSLEVVRLESFVTEDPLTCVVELVSKEPSLGGGPAKEET